MIYEPAEDSYLLESEVKKYCKNKNVLDIGSGSGIQAFTALNSGAISVTASDINIEAVNELKNKGLNAISSNLFSKIKGKFDLIVFNPPYLPDDKREDLDSKEITTGGKRGDEIILKFLKNAKSHLSPNGSILLLLSSLTPKNKILETLKNQNLIYSIISEKKLFMESLQVWKINKKL
jgi:release factor glutamine methyltransferase